MTDDQAPELVPGDAALKFHVSLNSSCLKTAAAFYRALLGIEPLKEYVDYIKFELANPPVVLSIKPQRMGRAGPLNHLGFRVANPEQLVEIQRRLEKAGFRTGRQDGVECCYAKQTKFWVADPDGVLWEIYVLQGDIDYKGSSHGLSGMLAPVKALGVIGSLRRGLNRPLAALQCWWSRKCAQPSGPPPSNATQEQKQGESQQQALTGAD